MNTMFWEIGIFNIALVLMIFYQVFEDRKKYKDCMRFGRLLLACAAILVVDTLGWGIDGKPILGQVWITMVIQTCPKIGFPSIPHPRVSTTRIAAHASKSLPNRIQSLYFFRSSKT